jgi:hypothetical protein
MKGENLLETKKKDEINLPQNGAIFSIEAAQKVLFTIHNQSKS